jgi:hypothetical protein
VTEYPDASGDGIPDASDMMMATKRPLLVVAAIVSARLRLERLSDGCRAGQPAGNRRAGLGVTTLTLADLRREVVHGLLHLSRLSLSRCVRFTNRFTEPVLDLWLP